MPSLEQTLLEQDIGFLRIVADLWRVEVNLPDLRTGRKHLVEALLEADLVSDIYEALPVQAHQALAALQTSNNRLPVAQFTRRYGEIREMGVGRREREKPHLNPASTSEALYYRGLIGHAFFNLGDGTQEYVFIPDELLELLPKPQPQQTLNLGRPATPAETKAVQKANDQILDEACTLLAGLRIGLSLEEIETDVIDWQTPLDILLPLLRSAKILDERNQPKGRAVQSFLEAPRGEALLQLVNGWLNGNFNDLTAIPHLTKEGSWNNDSAKTRQQVLNFLTELDLTRWQSLNAWIETIHQQHPDFQRSGGEYNAWFLRDNRSGDFLKGEQYWFEVEGALLRFIVRGPLHWLGIMDLAGPDDDNPPIAFRFSANALDLLRNEAPSSQPEDENIVINSRLEITCPPNAPPQCTLPNCALQ